MVRGRKWQQEFDYRLARWPLLRSTLPLSRFHNSVFSLRHQHSSLPKGSFAALPKALPNKTARDLATRLLVSLEERYRMAQIASFRRLDAGVCAEASVWALHVGSGPQRHLTAATQTAAGVSACASWVPASRSLDLLAGYSKRVRI